MEKNYDMLKLENQLCFPLYAAARQVVRRYRPLLDALDLTYTQYLCLMVLWEHKRCNVKELGEKLYLDSGTLTPVLKSLEGKGYVRRLRSSADERILNVEITPEGETLKISAAEIPAKIADCVPLTSEEAGQMYRLLYKILTALEN